MTSLQKIELVRKLTTTGVTIGPLRWMTSWVSTAKCKIKDLRSFL